LLLYILGDHFQQGTEAPPPLQYQGTEASHIMNPPPLERQQSKSVPPPSTNLNPFYDHKTIHPTPSSDTIDSNSRPTSVARKDSNRGTYT
jgi:hypothetical protein